ncbi:MAG: long-chain fatty acid--CoA ligase [Sulfobacillus acidophilus]|uniref:Long-chain fatty acid--CoA ligase n=1 Tax=Sulfobacillus acidophilus TaxID=53633 RepID=A0A2T2WLT4_9FIRM|nr:MAG: long-chain fatty acid--CoA ligase [Sulfobacillus acidophilus]
MPLEELARRLYPPSVPHTIEVPDWRVQDLLQRASQLYPDHDALIFYQARWNYQQLWSDAQRFARALQDRGLAVGERVAIMLPNSPQYVIAYFGILLAGGIVTQINPLLVERELREILQDSGSRMLLTLDALLPRAANIRSDTALQVVIGVSFQGKVAHDNVEDFGAVLASALAPSPQEAPTKAGDAAVLQYTGGTTGRSKGAILTHRNLVANVVQLRAFGEYHEGEERILGVIPLFHVYGMTVVMNLAVYLGASMILLPRFEVTEVFAAIRDHQVTMWPGVPTMYVALLQVPSLTQKDVQSIRFCNSGSAPMPASLIRQFEERTGAALLEGYGLTETSPVTHANPSWGVRKAGTVGLSVPSTEFRIVDAASGQDVPLGTAGELWIRGPQVMQGYWQNPDETAKTLVDGGWLRTGDIASCDEEGYVSIVDRLKDLIIASGYNVYPREVEDVLYNHPDVLEAVVVGAPDPYRGETVRAVVVPKPNRTLTQEDLKEYLAANLAAYKRPTIIELRSELPKSAVGKILRRVIRDEPVGKDQQSS